VQPFELRFLPRPYQRRAIEAIEAKLGEDRRAMLVAMATGTGKTKLAIALLYRLLTRNTVLPDLLRGGRNGLGEQAAGEFKTTRVVSVRTFADIFGLKELNDVTPDPETRVHICTIQGLVQRVLFAPSPAEMPSIDQYDLMVVDECHRGYLLDREMSDAEMSFRSEDDYISKYRRVLEHFDATKIGLTAAITTAAASAFISHRSATSAAGGTTSIYVKRPTSAFCSPASISSRRRCRLWPRRPSHRH
jgi:type I restriction enzyme R subunit